MGKSAFQFLASCSIVIAAPAYAQAVKFDIPASDLKQALDAYRGQSQAEIFYRLDDIKGVRSGGVRGVMPADDALAILLKGTGFVAEWDGSGAVAIVRRRAGPNAEVGEQERTEIVVTGSRIRGGQSTAPVTVQTAKQMRDAGQTNLGDVVRSLPQSFGGGQNPTVVAGAGGTGNINVGSSSTVNLRGLGADATLTLLNGHRVAYNGSSQGVDIGAIPLAAVDRLEVIADGASAIYGSDAVGGVANVILKRDYQGLSTTARLGGSTDGGNFQQQYSAVAGQTWSSGGVMIVGDFERDTAIDAGQRSYTATPNGDQTLIPYRKQFSGLVSGHLDLAPNVKLLMDATYSHRDATIATSFSPSDVPSYNGVVAQTTSETFSVSPRLEVGLPGRWMAALSGTFARDRTNLANQYFFNGADDGIDYGPYNNTARLIELSGEGPLFAIGSGDARLAVGAGYRSNTLDAYDISVIGGVSSKVYDFKRTRDSYYAYSELYLPLISPADGSVFHRLAVTGAVRYENYPGTADLATPKVGVIFSPIDAIELKGSWGRSFKTPTLYQEGAFQQAVLYPASRFGPGYPSNSTTLLRAGGNPDLTPERARTWSATLAVHPSGTNARIEASYFNIHYNDRIVRPIPAIAGAFGTPGYQSLITYSPTPQALNAAIAAAPLGLQSNTSLPYNPATVVAIVDNRYVNIAQQKLHGVDIAASYDLETAAAGKFSASVLASYLFSNLLVVSGKPLTPMAGTVFNPPNWRARGSLTWSYGQITANGSVNYVGSLDDLRFTPAVQVDAVTTADFTFRYTFPGDGLLKGFDVAVSVLNAFNAKPPLIRTSNPTAPPFDSTNYSAVGRFVGISVTKAW